MLKLGLDEVASQWRVSCVAADLGLVFYDKIAPSPSNPTEVIWTSPDGETRLYRIEDQFIGQTFIAIDGPDAARVEAGVRDGLPVRDLAEALARIGTEETDETRLETAALLGWLAPPQFDAEVFAAFETLLESPSPAVRAKAVSAMAYPVWPEFRPLLRRLAAEDEDPDVRARAEVALQAFERTLGKHN